MSDMYINNVPFLDVIVTGMRKLNISPFDVKDSSRTVLVNLIAEEKGVSGQELADEIRGCSFLSSLLSDAINVQMEKLDSNDSYQKYLQEYDAT